MSDRRASRISDRRQSFLQDRRASMRSERRGSVLSDNRRGSIDRDAFAKIINNLSFLNRELGAKKQEEEASNALILEFE